MRANTKNSLHKALQECSLDNCANNLFHAISKIAFSSQMGCS
jgi:hypothetical protein